MAILLLALTAYKGETGRKLVVMLKGTAMVKLPILFLVILAVPAVFVPLYSRSMVGVESQGGC